MRSKLGYFFGGFLIFFAATVAVLAWSTASSTMEGMTRVRMPGHASITLPPGPTYLYAEGPGKVACNAVGLVMRDAPDVVTYDLAGHRGRKIYDVESASGGTFDLVCTVDGGGPLELAFGAGVGAWMVIAWLALIPAVIGLSMLVATFIRRRRAR